jgi:hypothetical protein
MTRSSSKADHHPPEPTINDVIVAPAMEAPSAEAKGAQHPVPPSPQRRQCLALAASTREKNERELSNESEDAFVFMCARGRRKHTIRVLAADWSNDRRCGSRPSEVQLCVVFGISCLKHVAAPELPSLKDRAPSRGTRGSVGAHLSKEVRSGTTEHVAAPELTSARRRGSELRDTWRRRSSPQQGGKVRGHGTRDGSGVYLYREVWSEATTYVAARGYTPYSLS